MNPTALRSEAARYGLVVRGSFTPAKEDGVPPLGDGGKARSLMLLGNVGSSIWPAFSESPEYRDGAPDPLDRWSRRIGTGLAERYAGKALFPFGGPPYHPFIRWARRAEDVHTSELGMLIHPEFGLWHAYRFALALPLSDEPTDNHGTSASPCVECTCKPCLSACPVAAFGGDEYRVDDCVDHLVGDAAALCHREGCLSRVACPVGPRHRYTPAQARFHMKSFVLARMTARKKPRCGNEERGRVYKTP